MSGLRFRPHHQAVRDTHWVGKGTPAPWLVVIAILIAAGMLAYGLH